MAHQIATYFTVNILVFLSNYEKNFPLHCPYQQICSVKWRSEIILKLN